MSVLDNIPGYREAVARECFVRDAAYVRFNGEPLTEKIEQFEVRQMTYADFLALRLTKSPFIVGGSATPANMFTFIWRLSAHYPSDSERKKLLRACQCFILPSPPRWMRDFASIARWEKRAMESLRRHESILKAIEVYVSETLMDWPSSSGSGDMPSYFSDAATIVGMIARDYGWTLEYTMAMPMKCLLQQLREIRRAGPNGEKLMFNALSDAKKNEWLIAANREN